MVRFLVFGARIGLLRKSFEGDGSGDKEPFRSCLNEPGTGIVKKRSGFCGISM